MINSIYLYGSIAILTSLFAGLSVKKNFDKLVITISKIMTLLIPSFFAGVRYGIGTDYYSYEKIFENLKYGKFSRTEIGYKLINYIVAKLGGNVQAVFFIISFFTIFFVFTALIDNKDKLNVGYGMLIFMLLYYQFSYNCLRQALSIAISLFSFKYIVKRDFIKFFLITILSISFHINGIVIFPLYFLYSFLSNSDNRFYIIIFFCVFIFAVYNFTKILLPIFENIPLLEYYKSYLIKKDHFSFGLGVLIVNLPFIVPGVIYFKSLNKYDNNFLFYYSILLLGVVLQFLGYFGTPYVNRIALNLLVVKVFIIPYYFKVCKFKYSKILRFFLLFCVIMIWLFFSIYKGENGTIPYKWIFILD